MKVKAKPKYDVLYWMERNIFGDKYEQTIVE
jgi:hypothetical protein